MSQKAVIGAGISLDGEAAFRKAVSDIGKDMTVLSSEMKKVTAEFEDNAYSMEALTAKSAVYNKQIESQKDRIDTLKKALANAATEYGETDSKTKEWIIKLNNAEAGLSKLNSELKSNEANLKVMQTGIVDNGASITDTTGKTSKYHDMLTKVSDMTGIKIPAGLETFAVSAAATGAAVVVAFKVVGEITNTIQSNIEAASASFKELARSANEAQMGEQQMAALNYAAELANTTTNALIDGFTKTTELIGQVQQGNEGAINKFSELGISIKDNVTGEMKTAEEVFLEVAAVLGSIEDTTKRNATATNLFGGEAKTMFGIFEDGGKTLKEGINAAYDEGIVKSTKYYEQLKLVAKETDKINAQLDTIKSNGAIAWKEMTNGSDGLLDNITNLSVFLLQFIEKIPLVGEALAKMIVSNDYFNYDPYANKDADTRPDVGSGFTSAKAEEQRLTDERWAAYLNLINFNEENHNETISAINSFSEQSSSDIKTAGEKLSEDINKMTDEEIYAQKRTEQFWRDLPEAIKSGRGVIIDTYANGTDYVPKTGLYELHQGEKVVTAAENRSGSGDTIINLNVDISKIQDVDDLIRIAKGAKQSYRMGVV